MTRRPPHLLLAALLCAAPLGCGDPLVTGDYRGDILINIEGSLLIRSAARVPDTLSVAIFWMGADQLPWTLAEQPVVSRGLALSRYQLQLYQPPPSQVFIEHSPGQRFGLAMIMLYDDADRSGTWDIDRELLVGGASQYALLYAPQPLDEALFGETLSPGYHLMRLDDSKRRCGQHPGVAAMTPVSQSLSVNLIVFGDLDRLLPDLDCDGYVGDWCEPILDDALRGGLPTPAQQRALADDFVACLRRAGADAPCLDLLPPAAFFGDAVNPQDLDPYDLCLQNQEQDDSSPYAPQDECDFFLQEARWADSPEQLQELYTLYEQCMEDYKL